jgi:hypothetical protein
MAKAGQGGLEGIAAGLPRENKGLPPVERWNPPFCGDIDMRIAQDGLWYYLNSPIGRKPLMKLFASVLRHDEDGKYYLVTPVEKCGIRVDDAPFVAIRMSVAGKGRNQVIGFETNTDDIVTIDVTHPMRVAVWGNLARPWQTCCEAKAGGRHWSVAARYGL